MSTSLEDRLRAHFAELTERQSLPGPETDEALDQLLAQASPSRSLVRRRPGRHTYRSLTIAAAVAAVCAAAGLVVATHDQPSGVRTGPDEGRTTTVPAPTSTTLPTTVPRDTTSPPPSTPVTSPAIAVAPWGQIGWWDGAQWVGAAAGLDVPTSGGEDYQLVRLDDPITTHVGEWGEGCVASGEPQGRAVHVEFPRDVEPAGIAITGVADPRPRPVRAGETADETYRDAARAVLAELGITDPDPEIAQVVTGDLDGDGSDEILVVAQRVSAGGDLGESGSDDYSVVFMRRVVNGIIQTTVVRDTRTQSSGGSFYLGVLGISALADLNGDGRMEIVLEDRHFEGMSIHVHELGDDGSTSEVLSGECGS